MGIGFQWRVELEKDPVFSCSDCVVVAGGGVGVRDESDLN